MKNSAIVLVSGGMDSCVTAALAAEQYDLAFLHVTYGQRTAARERKAFNDMADFYGVNKRLVTDIAYLREIGGSALTDDQIPVPIADCGLRIADSRNDEILTTKARHREIPKVDDEEATMQSNSTHCVDRNPIQRTALTAIPVTYVPFRNTHLLAIAVSWAEVIEVERVFIGAVAEDSSGYPDCRPEYYQAFNRLIKVGTKPETHIEVITPVIHLRKSAIVRRGLELGAPLHLSWSCYQATDRACGQCESCALRIRGFQQAGAIDPIPYAIPIQWEAAALAIVGEMM